MSSKQLWMGIPTKRMQWVPAPLADAEMSRSRFTESIKFENGGGDARKSSAFQKEYTFNYNQPLKGSENLSVFNKFASGYYGDGLVCFADPYIFDINMFNEVWSTPALSEYGWPTIYTGDPTFGNLLGVLTTNLATNPSFETATSGATVFRTNLVTNPSFEVNTTGWAGSATNTRTTLEAYVGSASYQSVAASLGQTAATAILSGLTSGAAHTASAWVKGESGKLLRIRLLEYTSADAFVGETASTDVVASGSWQRISVTRTFGATGAKGIVSVDNRTSGAHTFFTDAVLLEASTTLNPYFDGSFGTVDGVLYQWTGTANASTSTAKAALVEVRRNLAVNPSFETAAATTFVNGGTGFSNAISAVRAFSGTNSNLATFGDGTAQDSGPSLGNLSIVSGTTYTISAYIYVTDYLASGGLRIAIFGTGVPGSITRASLTTVTNQWVRTSVTFTATANGTPTVFIGKGATGSAAGLQVYIDAVLLEASPILGDYFDGATTAGGDFTYAWTGTANASASVQQGVGGAQFAPSSGTIGGGDGRAYLSSEWASTGSRSLRITPISASNGTQASLTGSGASAIQVVPGATYTAIAKIRLTAPLTGTLGSGSRCIGMRFFQGAEQLLSTPAPNVAGVHEVRFTFTVPAGRTEMVPRLFNGASAGNGDVWWDDFLLIEGTYTGGYFDGSTTDNGLYDYSWTGTANASTSTAQELLPRNGQPSRNAIYTITTAANTAPTSESKRFTIPIPPSHTLWLGASGTRTGTAVVQVRPIDAYGAYAATSDLTLLDPNGTTRLNASFSGASYSAVEVYLTRTSAATSTITLASMMAQLHPTGTTPTLTGDHQQGLGHTGLMFVDDAQVESYLYINPPRKGLTTTLVEVGAWRP